MSETEKIWQNMELMQTQIDSNAIILIALASYLRDDPKFAEHLKTSFDGYMAARLNHSVSQRYLDELQNSLASKLPPMLQKQIQ